MVTIDEMRRIICSSVDFQPISHVVSVSKTLQFTSFFVDSFLVRKKPSRCAGLVEGNIRPALRSVHILEMEDFKIRIPG